MSEIEKRPDQAENLRTKMIDDYKELHGDYPPRGEVHKDKEKKTKLKMKYPIISLLALFFILMPILFLSITFYFGSGGNQVTNRENSSGNETVFISNGQQTDEELDIVPIVEEGDTSLNEEASTEDVDIDNIETSEAYTEDKISELDVQKNQEIQQKQTNSSTEDTSKNIESAKSSESVYSEVKTHRVSAGETLFNISIKYYNSRSGEEIIRQYNGIEANNIYEGQMLKIPIK